MKLQCLKLATILLLSGLISQNGFAEDLLNGKQAAEACKQEIVDAFAGSIDFQRNPASSMKSGTYTFWINATEDIAGERTGMKYQCEITRTGELVGLTREPGRWRI